MSKLTVLSLFDGMSCGQIALNKLGIKDYTYYASEIKPHAIKVTQDNYPHTVQLGDVTKVTYEDGILYSENGEFNVGRIDMVIGGSPCQNFSQACIKEKRLGLEGEKSKLFYEYLRILEEVKPKYFLLENVASMGKNSIYDLNKYIGVNSIKINSKDFSAQLRNRLYWTNVDVDMNYEIKGVNLQSVLTEGYSDRIHSRCLLESDSRPVKTPLKMFHRYYSTGFTTLVFKSEEHYIECKKHYDSLYKGLSAKEIDTIMKNNDNSVYEGIRILNQIELERLQTVPEGYTKAVTRNEAASLLGDGWTVDVIVHIFKSLVDEFK